jgi:GT2 family glycosyltransferase
MIKMAPIVTMGLLYLRKPILLKKCIYLVQKHATVPYEILVCCQGEPIYVQEKRFLQKLEKMKNVRLVRFKRNMGLGYGFKFLTENFDTPFFYMMAEDILVTKKWLDPLFYAMKNHENLGAVASIPFLNGIEEPPPKGGRLEIRNSDLIIRHLTEEERIKEQLEEWLIPADIVTTGCCLFRHEIFESATFDPNLIYGIEGIVGLDFWLQLKNSEWKIAWCKTSIVHHRPWLCSIDEYIRRRLFRTRENLRSREYFMKKHRIRRIERVTRTPINPKAKAITLMDLIKGTLLTFP